MTARLDRAADESTARWLCHGCGATYPITGPAYPVCACGQRCRMVDADGLPFVGSPEERLEAAQRAHEEAYAQWRRWLDGLKREIDYRDYREEVERRPIVAPTPLERWLANLAGAAHHTNNTAEHLDRVEAEVARLEETTA